MRATIFDLYHIKLTLLREMLATNPSDPHIHNTHILSKQRELILDKSDVNTAVNKYLGQMKISAEKGDEELSRLVDSLETVVGYTFTPEQRDMALTGKLEALKETFQSLDLKGATIFFWDKETNRPCIGDHMIYGYMKAAAKTLCQVREKKNGTILQSATYTHEIINTQVRCVNPFIVANKDLKRNADGTPYFLERSLRVITAQGPRVTLAKSEVIEPGTEFEFDLRVLKNSKLTEDFLLDIFEYGQYFNGLGQWRNSGRGMFSSEIKCINAEVDIPLRKKTATAEQQPTVQ
jgi:hypothetical protein